MHADGTILSEYAGNGSTRPVNYAIYSRIRVDLLSYDSKARKEFDRLRVKPRGFFIRVAQIKPAASSVAVVASATYVRTYVIRLNEIPCNISYVVIVKWNFVHDGKAPVFFVSNLKRGFSLFFRHHVHTRTYVKNLNRPWKSLFAQSPMPP